MADQVARIKTSLSLANQVIWTLMVSPGIVPGLDWNTAMSIVHNLSCGGLRLG
jgi:hypothetical protein